MELVYGEDNEKILGEAIKPYRDDVVIATKLGYYVNLMIQTNQLMN